MNSVGFILTILLCAKVYAYTPFNIIDCSNSSNKVASVGDVQLLQYPITIPGDVRVSATINVLRPVIDNLRLDVTVQKYLLFDYFTVPCVYRVGSCDYDFCGLLRWFEDRGCPWQLRVSNNIPCVCPLQNGTYTLRPYPFHIYPVSSTWQWIAFGDYRITGRLTDTVTNEEVGCYTVEFTTQVEQQEESWFWSW